jgi:hypothetical protein
MEFYAIEQFEIVEILGVPAGPAPACAQGLSGFRAESPKPNPISA